MAIAMFSHLPGREGSRGRDHGETLVTARVASVQSFTFILVGRSGNGPETSPHGSAGLSTLLAKDFMTLQASCIQPAGGRKHGERVIFLGILGKLFGGKTHLAGVLSPAVCLLPGSYFSRSVATWAAWRARAKIWASSAEG